MMMMTSAALILYSDPMFSQTSHETSYTAAGAADITSSVSNQCLIIEQCALITCNIITPGQVPKVATIYFPIKHLAHSVSNLLLSALGELN